jgi:hypothetical protein
MKNKNLTVELYKKPLNSVSFEGRCNVSRRNEQQKSERQVNYCAKSGRADFEEKQYQYRYA